MRARRLRDLTDSEVWHSFIGAMSDALTAENDRQMWRAYLLAEKLFGAIVSRGLIPGTGCTCMECMSLTEVWPEVRDDLMI